MSIRITTNIFCPEKNKNCPYLDFSSVPDLLAERNYLREKCNELQLLYNINQQQVATLQNQINELKLENEHLKEELRQALQRRFKKNIHKVEDTNTSELSQNKSRKRGAPRGHQGRTRSTPENIDQHIHVSPEHCPRCGCKNLTPCNRVDEHTIEDITILKPMRIRFYRHYKYCPVCKETVSVRATNDLPKSYLGPIAKAVAAHLRYKIRIPYEKVKQIFNDLYGLKITPAGLVNVDYKISEYGQPFYELLHEILQNSNSVNSDETGWRIDGINHWIWGLSNKNISFFHIDRHRSSEIAEKCLGKFSGILTIDFYSAYNSIQAFAKQRCLAHLSSDIKDLQETVKDNPEVTAFCENLKNLIQSAMELRLQALLQKIDQIDYQIVRDQLVSKLDSLAKTELQHEQADTLRRRLAKYQNEILTFLDFPEIEPTNNRAERQLRHSVVFRKITYGNRSLKGANNHQVIMSLLQTAELNSSNPLNFLLSLLTRESYDKISKILLGSQEPRAP